MTRAPRSGGGGSRAPGPVPGDVLLTVAVRPRAARDEVVCWQGTCVTVRVHAPPVGGAANDAVRRLLADALGCPRSAVEIVRGAARRTKRVRVAGLSASDLGRRLAGVESPRG